MAGKIQWLLCATTLGLLAQAQGEFVFYDTFQARHDTSPNIDYAARQINGLVTSSYNLATAGRFENLQRIYDNDSDGESALSLGVFKPLGGSNSVSWTASRTATDLGSHLSGERYAITLDSRFFNAGGNPAGFDTAFAVGILGSAGATTTPMTASSIFGIRLNGAGGGFGIYADGNLVAEQSTGSSITWAERFKLTLVVDETNSTVEVFVQGGASQFRRSFFFEVVKNSIFAHSIDTLIHRLVSCRNSL